MNDTERVNDIIKDIQEIIYHIEPMGKHCKIDMIPADVVSEVLIEAMERLEYLNNIRWDEIQ